MAEVSSINQIVITAKDETGQAFSSVASGLKSVNTQVDSLINRYDPLGAKLRQLQSDFKALDNAVKTGGLAGAESLTDSIYAKLNAEIAKTKGLIDQAGSGMNAASGNADKLNFATAGVTRELIVLGHEAMQGNFSRIPGSLVVMTERMGALHTLISAGTLLWGAVAAAIGLFVVAAAKGAEEAQAMNTAIAKTGDFAGLTRGQMLGLANQMADTGRITVGAAKDIVTQFVASGKIGAAAIGEVANLAAEYARQTGTDLDKVGGDLVKLFSDPAKGARELIDSFGGITVAQAEYIRHLQQQGEVTQAQLVLADALKAKLDQQQQPLGTLQKLWQGLKDAASSAWDAMLGIGRTKTPEEAYAEARQQAANLRAGFGATDFGSALGFALGGQPSQAELAASNQQVENAREMVSLLGKQNDSESRRAELVRQQAQAQDAVNKGQLGQIKNLQDEIALIQKYGDGSVAANQKIAEDQKQIASIYRSMDADRRAQLEASITAQQKLADISLDAQASEVDAQLKLGQISQIEHDKRITQLQLERNENAINAALQMSQISTLTAAERAKAQATLSELAAQRELIQQSGANKINEDVAALQASIAKIHGELPGFSDDFQKLQKDLQDAYENGLFGPPGIAALQKYADLTNQLLAQQPFAVRWREAQAAIEKANGAYQTFLDKIRDGNERVKQQIDDLGKMPDEIARANAELRTQQEIDKELNDLATQYAVALQKNPALAAQLLDQINDLLDRQGQLVSQAGDLAAQYAKARREFDDWKSIWSDVADEGAKFISDFAQHGSSAFKNLWDDFKTWALEAFAKIAEQQIVVSIAGAFGGTATAAANQLFGAGGNQSNPILNLLGGNGGVGSFLSNGAIGIASSGFGQAVGLSSAVGGSAGIAADAIGGIPGGVAADTALTSAGSLFASAAPFIPLLAAAIPLLGSLFSKDPSQVRGQFQVSAGTAGFEDNVFTHSSVGNLGFADANTQQFSGQAAQVFNQIVGGAIDAFSQRFSPEQQQHLSDVLQKTAFPTSEGTFTTEDFLKQYGGQVLQQIVVAAFNELDPALASVAQNFTGTADEIAKFANSLLGIYDATQKIGNAGLTANVDAALAGADQATADKVLAFVTIVQTFGDAITGLGPKLEALDAGSITAFVDALGGAQQALSTMAFIQTNFTTTAQRNAQAQAQLTRDFANLHEAVPATHDDFLALLNSFDLTTDSGRQLYAQVAALAPLFVQVAGTADQAAQALQQQIASAEQVFSQNFFTPAEQAAKQMADYQKQIADAQDRLGVSIPTTIDGFRNLIEGLDRSTDAGEAMYESLIVLAPAVLGLNKALGDLSDTVTQTTNQIVVSVGDVINAAAQQAQTLLNQFSDLAGNSTGDFGEKLSIQIGLINSAIANTDKAAFTSTTAYNVYIGTLRSEGNLLTGELARFTVLSAQYDAARAEQLVALEQWDAQQKQLFHGNADALAALDVIFHEKWDAIVNGVKTGVDGTIDQLARLQQSIADYLKGLQVGSLSPLSPKQQLDQAQEAYIEELVKAQSGDLTALGDITKFADAYLKQAQDFFSAPSADYRDIFAAVTGQLGDLAGTLPNGLPTSTTSGGVAGDAIAAVVPTNGKMASQTDIQDLAKQLIQAIADSAAANSEDVQQQTTTLTTKTTLRTLIPAK